MKSRDSMSAYQMAELFYGLFFESKKKLSIVDYLDHSFCDEIGEVDFTNDKFSISYHVEGKYFSPTYDGTFTNLYTFILDHIVHPDDKDIYDDLMNPKTCLQKLSESPTPNFRFAHFRFKLQDGSWRWVEQATIAGDKYGIKPGVVRFYIFDIHNTKVRELGQTNDESRIFDKSHNELTGLYGEKAFYRMADAAIKKRPKIDWVTCDIDIEHFKLFDEWYGREQGDFLLARIGAMLNKYCESHHGVGGYFGQDDFGLLVPFDLESFQKILDDIRDIVNSFGLSAGFLPAMGVARVSDFADVYSSFDRASIATSTAKKDLKNRIHIYDPSMQWQSEKEYHAMLDFMEALKNDEITFYLQPQCRISSGAIVGAEALARWVKKDGTIVPPMDFIPVLEKFGFIADLDKHIWEQVAKFQRELLDKGIAPVPISVNVSQVDIFLIDVAEFFETIVRKYDLDTGLIKIEITESAYAETTSLVTELVKKLRKMGFLILMDDFGSGYSSLNMLSTVKLDVIKLDAQFLNLGEKDIEKGIHILESVINMAKSISLPMIVEGIETQQQAKFLEELGCRYAQGFYFYKAMSKEDYINLITQGGIVDRRGFVVKLNEQFRIREFLDKNIYSDNMLNNILGAVAFYSWEGNGRVDIVRFNEQFYRIVDVPDFHQRLNSIEQYMPVDDRPKIISMLQEAIANRLTGSSGILHFYKTDGTLSTYFMKFYYLGMKEGTHRFYGVANNITDFSDLQRQLRLITQYTSDTFVFLKQNNDKWSFFVACHGLSAETGLTKEELQKEFDDGSFFSKHLDPRSAKSLIALALDSVRNHKEFSRGFKFKNSDGKAVRLHIKGDVVDEKVDNIKYMLTLRLLNE